jgi:hypothetical protein
MNATRIDYAITGDLPNGRPQPPPDGIVWRVIRRRNGRTLWCAGPSSLLLLPPSGARRRKISASAGDTIMDMRKYSGASFIKVEDVRSSPIRGQIAVIKPGKYDKPDLVFETGEILGLNTTNNRALVRAYGPNSDDWVGKEIELLLGEIEYQGKMQEAVLVKPISPPIPEKAKAAAAKKLADELNDKVEF